MIIGGLMVVMPCGLVGGYQHYKHTAFIFTADDGGSMFLQNSL
jgi:hypothetical protein